MKVKEFFKNLAFGAVIGVAMIIPGVSGGTLAVLLNVYDKLINAISDLKKDFKNSFFFLLPLVLGALLGIGALYFPLKYALERAPLPTVLLFTGLMLGSFPKLIKDTVKCGFNKLNVISFIMPVIVVVGICCIYLFVPSAGDVNLGADMPVGGYFLLLAIGLLGSCALVVPGISGSLLLLILGYYQPILNTVSALLTNFGHSLLVLVLFFVGIVIGFFSIAKLMKWLLKKFPRGTNWAILGFVVGSIPAIFITFNSNFPEANVDAIQIAVGVILCIAGIIASYALTSYAEKHMSLNTVEPSTPFESEENGENN